MATVKKGIGHFDHAYIKTLVLPTVDFWYTVGATPNTLTTLGLLNSVASIYYYSIDEKFKAVITLLFRMYFDYSDGVLARKYKITTSFGDYYDHYTDVLWFLGMLYVTMQVYPYHQRPIILFGLTVTAALFSAHQSCVELKNGNDAQSLSVLQYLQPTCEQGSEFLRLLFDNSSIYAMFMLLIINRPAKK